MPNRLAGETSPYLQQHAGNPVDWYPWGPEALARAKAEDKPILLSIGYSACHWCHVMERESFENAETAALMNGSFVNIKVDREERPDLDQVYQLVVQLMGRNGGWPLTVFLTPDQRPFFGGTYFPPADRYGMPGFPKVLRALADAYRAKPGEIAAQADEMTRAMREVSGARAGEGARAGAGSRAGSGEPRDAEGAAGAIDAGTLRRAATKLASRFDDVNGGFGTKPKFPNTMTLDVLLRAGDEVRVRQALDAMRAGGIWDHLGGGFHRYSTDAKWLVPHFEKMLYDNALLLRLYVDAWRKTGAATYEETARAIAAYVAREMTAPEGGFYATQDADSEGEEGKFFVWTPAAIDAACGADEEAARVAKAVYDVTEDGNFEGSGATVLSTPEPLDRIASKLTISRETLEISLERARARCFALRETRPKPARDEKILASWNGLMAGALAEAGAAFGEPAFVAAATRALAFVEAKLVVRAVAVADAGAGAGASPAAGATRVLRHWREGVARGPGFLDDHAFVADAALDLYDATGEARWVTLARALGDAILAHFYDAEGKSFPFTSDDGEAILVRPRDPFDNAVPGAASIAAKVLLRLGALVDGDEAHYAGPATAVIERVAGAAVANPFGMSVTIALADRLANGTTDVVLVGPRSSPALQALARVAHRAYLPNRALAWLDPADPSSREACRALAEGKPTPAEPAAYVCRGRTCSLPITDPTELARALR